METTVKLLRMRLQARLALTKQFASLGRSSLKLDFGLHPD